MDKINELEEDRIALREWPILRVRDQAWLKMAAHKATDIAFNGKQHFWDRIDFEGSEDYNKHTSISFVMLTNEILPLISEIFFPWRLLLLL